MLPLFMRKPVDDMDMVVTECAIAWNDQGSVQRKVRSAILDGDDPVFQIIGVPCVSSIALVFVSYTHTRIASRLNEMSKYPRNKTSSPKTCSQEY